MRPRENQLIVVILLLIVISAIVFVTCLNLAHLVNAFSDCIGVLMTKLPFGI